MLKKLTPILVVDRIEPLLPLWKALGFTATAEVPHGDALGFVMLGRDGIEVMYQTVDSIRDDSPKALEGARPLGAAALFFEVDDLEGIAAQIPAGTDVLIERRKTFYGSTETAFRDGAGNVITFAQFG
jgi:catechol 2,3-dioxygenase-like lactoylglutathione lyase family enzyme